MILPTSDVRSCSRVTSHESETATTSVGPGHSSRGVCAVPPSPRPVPLSRGHDSRGTLSPLSAHRPLALARHGPMVPVPASCHAQPRRVGRGFGGAGAMPMPSPRWCGCPPSIIRTDTGPYRSKFVLIPDTPCP